MTRQTKLRIVITVGVFFLIASVLVWPFAAGSPRMKSFCESLSPGTSVTVIRERATERGYRFMPPMGEGQQPGIVIDERAMGRFVCEVRLSDDRLVAAQYRLND